MLLSTKESGVFKHITCQAMSIFATYRLESIISVKETLNNGKSLATSFDLENTLILNV